MSKLKTKMNSKAALNALSLKANIRSMLRRNLSFMTKRSGLSQSEKERQKLKSDTEGMAAGFAFMLSIMVTYMTDEDICDFLDSWKHIITDGPRELIEFE